MANVKHFHRSAVRSILNHVKRIDNYSNKDIDCSRSKYNFSLTQQDPFEVYNKRLSEVHCLNRANVNTLSSWCVTLPKGVKREDQRKFFEETAKFLNKRYGERNNVCAEVHFDETTPHLHYCFIPVIFDQKHQREKVDRKSIFTLKELKTFHTDLQTHINQVLGYEVQILNGALKNRKNLSVGELKERTAEELRAKQELIHSIDDDIETKPTLFNRMIVKKEDYLSLKTENLLLKNKLAKENEDLNAKNKKINAKERELQLREMNYLSKKDAKPIIEELKRENEELLNKNKDLSLELFRKKSDYLKVYEENSKLKEENKKLSEFKDLALKVIQYSLKVVENLRTHDFNSNALYSSLNKILDFCKVKNISISRSRSR